ncbi:MAG: 2,3-bisphosphoglycerate-independent phosphoglycerate mutase [Sulfuricurvum sp.]|nr:2,3-bisphosphoglycerate-independent phosphoglycerate mutase [Sulfuricurvum sp.]
MRKKTVLVITDGIGYSPKRDFNAFTAAQKPTYDWLFREVPHSLIDTSGLSVGLPEGQMGNSEVGHMSIGSGRVLYQDLVKISLALEDGSFARNEPFCALLKSSNRLHLISLMSDGGVHSHIDHLIGVAEIAAEAGREVWLHLITDGRDVAPTSALLFLQTLMAHGNENIKIASLGGRFYAMDRDNRWERVQKGVDAIALAHPKSEQSVSDYIENAYAQGETDEFITPCAFDGYEGFKEGDAVLTLNFRSDRMRQLASALGDPAFKGFERTYIPIHLSTMTQYDKNLPLPVLFPKDAPTNTLAEVIADAGLRQLHTAETEKYAHVTFFFNGGIEEPYENETRVLIPSPQVKTYDMQPQMSAPEVGDAVIKAMDAGYDFVVVNFANGDMVGHTGNYEAAIRGVEAVDTQLQRIVDASKRNDYAMVITSDHGNCEEMCDDAGNMSTNHTVGKVWCFVMAEGVTAVHPGALNNIAPTVLKLMGIEKPEEMDQALI